MKELRKTVNLCRGRKKWFDNFLSWQEKTYIIRAVKDFGDQILLPLPHTDESMLPGKHK